MALMPTSNVAASGDAAEQQTKSTYSNSIHGIKNDFTNCTGSLCSVCGYDGSDVLVQECGCIMHTRCISLLSQEVPMKSCPNCRLPASNLHLFPMSFPEGDSSRNSGASISSYKNLDSDTFLPNKRRKCSNSGSILANDDDTAGTKDHRTGRWTQEEMDYVDALIHHFEKGNLPLCTGVKLNDFLGGMLKCKQSRLTKKMKNAKLSSKVYTRRSGCIAQDRDPQRFSRLEHLFLRSVSCDNSRDETKFHLQKQWREYFSNLCIEVGQVLQVDEWLGSVEILERRDSAAKDAARHAKRKVLMGCVMERDADTKPAHKVAPPDDILSLLNDKTMFVDPFDAEIEEHQDIDPLQFTQDDNLNLNQFDPTNVNQFDLNNTNQFDTNNLNQFDTNNLSQSYMNNFTQLCSNNQHQLDTNITNRVDTNANANLTSNTLPPGEVTNSKFAMQERSPFLKKITDFCKKMTVPFEYAEVWVPAHSNGIIRLCYAGNSIQHTADLQSHTDLVSFGQYSAKFTFPAGSGLPGRVFESGVPVWEQSIHNAPSDHFQRCSGAMQWNVKTVLGIPVSSPNVGRVVVALFSCKDIDKNCELVGLLCDEFVKYSPVPKWKLTLDCGSSSAGINGPSSDKVPPDLNIVSHFQKSNSNSLSQKASSTDNVNSEVISLLGKYMPCDPGSPNYAYAPGFMSLRLMLLRINSDPQEIDLVKTLLGSYASYKRVRRDEADTALLLAQDCMFLMSQRQARCSSSVVDTISSNNFTSTTPHLPPFPEMNSERKGKESLNSIFQNNNSGGGENSFPLLVQPFEGLFPKIQLPPLYAPANVMKGTNGKNNSGTSHKMSTTPLTDCHVVPPFLGTNQPAIVSD